MAAGAARVTAQHRTTFTGRRVQLRWIQDSPTILARSLSAARVTDPPDGKGSTHPLETVEPMITDEPVRALALKLNPYVNLGKVLP